LDQASGAPIARGPRRPDAADFPADFSPALRALLDLNGTTPLSRRFDRALGGQAAAGQLETMERSAVNRKLVFAISAVALSLAVSGAAPVFAQQLTDSAEAGLAQLGYNTSQFGTITADQAAQIENVLSSNESEDVKVARIDALLGHPGDAGVPQPLGVQQLQDSVSQKLAALGITGAGVDTLTLTELAQIENVVNSAAEEESQKQQIEQILGRSEGAGTTPWGVQQLQSSVSADMAKLGITSDVESLSLSQLAQIENVVNSTDADDIKRQQIEELIAQ
jgi:hypothetical protein